MQPKKMLRKKYNAFKILAIEVQKRKDRNEKSTSKYLQVPIQNKIIPTVPVQQAKRGLGRPPKSTTFINNNLKQRIMSIEKVSM